MINPNCVLARVIDAVASGEVVAVVTQHLLDELTAVLTRPKFRRWLSVADAIASSSRSVTDPRGHDGARA